MSLFFPSALILGVFAIGILALHGRRQPKLTVPGLLLWRQVAQSRAKAVAAWRFPKVSLPLVLQVLALLVLVLALAHPVWGGNRDVEHWVVVLDNSVALDDEGFEQAAAEARAIAGAVSGQVRLSLLILNGRVEPVLARRSAGSQWDQALDGLGSGDGRADWAGAFQAIAGLVRADETTQIVAISPSTPDGMDLHEGTRFAHMAVPGRTGEPIAVDPVRPYGARVLHVGDAESPLAAAFAAVANVEVTQQAQLPDDTASYDLVVMRAGEAGDPDAPALTYGAGDWEGLGRPVFWDAGHVLSRGIDWSGLAIETNAALETAAGETVLLAGRNGPIITLAEAGKFPAIRLAFDPARANWTDQPALPVFAANVVDWLGAGSSACVAGESCVLPARFMGGEIVDPQGRGAVVLAREFYPQSAGVYTVTRGGERFELAVAPWPANVPAVMAAGEDLALPHDLTRWFVALALGLLVAEAGLALSRRARGAWLWARALAILAVLAALIDPAIVQPWRAMQDAVVSDLRGGEPEGRLVVADGAILSDGAWEDATPFYWDRDYGLRLADAALEPGGRIILDADAGFAEMGYAMTELAERGRVVDVRARQPIAGDWAVEGLYAPELVFSGDRVLLNALISTQGSGPVELVLTRNGEMLQAIAHDLEAGANRVDFPMSELEPGRAHYELSIAAAGDPVADNDRAGVWIEVRERPRVAVISMEAEPRAQFARMLDAQGLEALDLAPGRLPIRAEVYDDYDAVVLLDMPAIGLEMRQMALLEEMVREKGLGLFVLGGPNSFGPGGYLETPLEDLSPLSARLPHETPEVAMMFVLDGSGSMSQTVGEQTRLDLAKHSVTVAAGLLDPRTSTLGVVMFNSDADLIMPLQPVPDAATLTQGLAGVQPGGGTAIYPGLEAAYDALMISEAAARHVVVMTDGMSDPADFPSQLARFRDAGITVSAVAIGSTAETNIAEDLALLGGGRFHATADFEALPSILSQEALMLAGEMIEIGDFPLQATGMRPDYLDGLPEVLPPVTGFVQTTAKPGAEIAWSVEAENGEPRPLLGSWRYGVGNVLALSTAATGQWTENWQEGSDYPRLFAQAMRQFAGSGEADDWLLEARREGDAIVIDMRHADPLAELPEIAVTGPDGATHAVQLAVLGNGTGSGRFIPDRAGTYELSAHAGEDTISRRIDMGAPRAFSLLSDRPVLEVLSARTGGRVLDAADRGAAQGFSTGPVRGLWLLLAMALFFSDLVWRYRPPRFWLQRKRQ